MYLTRFTSLPLLLLVALTTGCADLHEVQTTSDQPRIGNVYVVRGFVGIWSLGMDDLADELHNQGVRTIVYQDAQSGALARQIAATYHDARGAEPLILVGHSLGADDVLSIAEHLNKEHVPVDLLITLDPVSHGPVTPNVRYAVNFYKSNGINVPIFRGVAVTAENPAVTRLENHDLRTDSRNLDPDGSISHFNIDDRESVRSEVIRLILAVCPQRQHGPQTRPQSRPPA